jgi:hypothetical protein
MRRTFGMHARFSQWSRFVAPVVIGSAGLVLTACASDTPTSVATSDGTPSFPTTKFTVPPGSSTALTLSSKKFGMMPSVLYETRMAQGRVKTQGSGTSSPWDLTSLGGKVVTTATNWNIYVNCDTPAGCWGTNGLTPANVLFDLNRSNLIQVANQYLGEDAAGQFTVAQMSTSYNFTNHTAQVGDIVNILVAAFIKTGGAFGYNNIYHVFLPKNTDMCLDAMTCYSPDVDSTFVFCAFHNHLNGPGGIPLLFSVEPYQFVGGCTLPAETRQIDATATALSHEFTETITDPLGMSWFNFLTGNEIGDLCFAFRFPDRLNRHVYVVQQEYSNIIHACAFDAYGGGNGGSNSP